MRKLLPIVLVLFACNVFGESIAELRKKAEAAKAAKAAAAAAEEEVETHETGPSTGHFGDDPPSNKPAPSEGGDYSYQSTDSDDNKTSSFGESKEIAKFRKIVEQGHPMDQFYFGLGYYSGTYGPKDYKEAEKWFRKAAEQGHAEAQFYLGGMYREGLGVPQNSKEGVKWYRNAAVQGFANAQFNLGIAYETGEGVVQDLVKAYACLNISTYSGNIRASYSPPKDAAKIRDDLAKRLTPEQIAEAEELVKELQKKIEASKAAKE